MLWTKLFISEFPFQKGCRFCLKLVESTIHPKPQAQSRIFLMDSFVSQNKTQTKTLISKKGQNKTQKKTHFETQFSKGSKKNKKTHF